MQANYATPQTDQSTVTATFSTTQTTGNLNVVVVGWNDSAAHVLSVTDSRGDGYQLAVGPTTIAGVASQAIYFGANIAGGANTVTVVFDKAARYVDLRIAEYSGLDAANPVDVVAAATGSGASSNSGSVVTTYANDLLIGANLVQTQTGGAGTGFTQRLLTSPDSDILEDRVVTAVGSYSATATVPPGGAWIMQLVALRASSTGGDVTPPSAPGTLTAKCGLFEPDQSALGSGYR